MHKAHESQIVVVPIENSGREVMMTMTMTMTMMKNAEKVLSWASGKLGDTWYIIGFEKDRIRKKR
jgi:hypothetical protein